MAKILYYDCFSGISGDMNLGALIDLGVDKKFFLEELDKLSVKEYDIIIEKGQNKGISGTKVTVKLHHQEEHVHRHLKDIEAIINGSDLSENIKNKSLQIFETIAKAEAKVHGTTIEKIHFHEVGAVDAIVDIVGAAVCQEYLHVDKIMASTVELGGGFVKCTHGKIPVPAPATVEILKNIPVKSGIVPFETTTPTGAAILASTVEEFTDNLSFNILKIGYGVGQRETEIPNVLRVYLGETISETKNMDSETSLLIECNIDDMNPETYDFVLELLFKEGANDAFLVPIIMKKSRPAIKLSVLCNKKLAKNIKEIIFLNTTTLGVREYEVKKSMLKRDFVNLKTNIGVVCIKRSYWDDSIIHQKPEYEDVKNLATKNNLSISHVYQIINEALIRFGDD